MIQFIVEAPIIDRDPICNLDSTGILITLVLISIMSKPIMPYITHVLVFEC